ncbi:DNA-3-methyladenine glycosylase family protein [Ilumatobacter sp.]|uniref:DNA-3-methyladenine glycosylase family protein n=1 Tax=Ilumatobacter sp. TaxID=1967498 RepID=UPI003B51D158
MAVLEHEPATIATARARSGADEHPDRRIRPSGTDVGASLAWYPHGRRDPTTRLERHGRGVASGGTFVRATLTPEGPGTVLVRWGASGRLDVETWGPGGAWLEASVPDLVGAHDPGAPELARDTHPVVAATCRAASALRHGRSSTLYHELLPTIIEQRITGIEAKRQWGRLCEALGDPAPGPFADLRLPPRPEVLSRQPSWWFHPLGIERSRARPLIEVARHASKLWGWADLPPVEAGAKLRLIGGIGVWTVGCVLGPALGDTDAVPVGDYHVKNVIGWNLAREARATDDRMLELLEPYAGQRGRVVRAVSTHGDGAPKFGPRQRILPMSRW